MKNISEVEARHDAMQFMMGDREEHRLLYKKLPYYRNVVFIGDSLAESLLDFRLLRKRNVVARRGRCVDMIDEDILRVILAEPQVVFMEYGKNDIAHFGGDATLFIEEYREKVLKIKNAIPGIKVYINSIIPMHDKIMCRVGGISKIREFNDALRSMCDELNLVFICNEQIMDWKDDIFEYDGVHPKYPFYPKWLKHMVEIANLDKE